jgi:A-macroglobulin TED domain/Alpha-2-macroglobulin family/Carboxypeptidase regulatory-like domain/A-macroglobulin receptor binding domain/MG2 domain/Alpha-2-macroglobulin bait region domain
MHTRPFTPSLRLLLPFALVLGAIAVIISLTHARAEEPAATYTHGRLAVTLPYQSQHEGSGKLVAEILDPEDHVLGRIERNVTIGKDDGSWQETITPDKPLPFDDIIWQRLHYHFEYTASNLPSIDGIESISQILRRPVVHIIGQTEYLAGSEAAIRVIVSDATNSDAVPSLIQSGTVHIDLLDSNQKSTPLFTGHLNRRGTVEAQLHFPANLTGRYSLHYTADTSIGSAEYTQPIQLNDKASILLTTEKPIYQPSQTIHIRALALDTAGHKADASRKLTFEVEDSRGNKVFKSATDTDKFGIASAEFTLADEVNLGTYHLRALMGDVNSPSNTAEIALNVERYILPKFKVAVDFTEKDGKQKKDYRPGDRVTGTIHANYFFGKPVDHADITIKASAMDVAVFEAATATGKTDADGTYHFDLKLSDYFAGRPLSQGSARALVEATVKDSAAHSETRGEPITISQSSLLITAIPESGALIPHLENQIFLLTSYPDGTPANTALTVHIPNAPNQQISTDTGGVAVIHLTPTTNLDSLRIEADDHHGNGASSNIPLQTRAGTDQILLRTTHAVVKTGERIQLNVLSTRPRGSAYIDIVKNGQTILTRDLDLQNGHADLTLNATPDMAGTLDINAYLFGRDAQPIADHRLIFVQPADELKIETTTNATTYKPGSEARVHFHITNCRGEGVSAALGLQVVDEAVFALAEKQPGFAKVFFYLEQEVMKPRYEIHSLSMSDAIEPVESRNDQHDLAARALFSATEIANPTKLDTEFGRSLPQDKFADYQQRYREAFIDQVRQLAEKLTATLSKNSSNEDITKAFTNLTLGNGAHPHDAWNTPFRIEQTGWSRGRDNFYRVRSAGPDGRFNSPDDLTVYLEQRTGSVVSEPGSSSGTLDLKIEHDRGPVNTNAEVTGTVLDPTGATIPNATITLRLISSANTRTARSNATGQFSLAGLPAGRYRAEIASPGFHNISREFTVQPRDRAVLSAVLSVGSVTEAVMVADAAMPVPMAAPAKAMGMARAGVFNDAAGPMAMNLIVEVEAAAASLPINNRNFNTLLKAESPAEPHIRSYFPEALYINPEIITDASGNADISVPIADSITTWRMAMLASTQSGTLGTSTSSLKVFQDFFVDLDLPVTLTQGDRVSIPVGIYNYSGKPGDVSLKLTPEDWFSLDNDTAEKSVSVESGHVGSSQFTLNTKRIGKFKLTLSAQMGTNRDIVVREIEVIPNGREQNLVFNGRLENTAQHDLHLPANSIPDASSIFIRLYPGPLSQVIEGMDGILRMPGGCFEQTSSSTYPNVLALDYMKRTKKLTPEVHAKAEGYIANGYQRLLTFEVPGGGFSWFGQAPANKILTAYGLMEFNDMSKVSDVDPRLIQRTGDWLARQQQPDGSWKPDINFINEGATNRYNSNVLRITAYIAWSLANAGYQGPAVERAKHYIETHNDSKPDTYTLAIIANFAADYGKDRDFTRRSMQALLEARTEKDDQVSWTVEETGVYSTGASAAIETTGLATQALLKWGQANETVRKALNFISSKKQAGGNWGTTQATIMALRSLLLASQTSASDVRGSLTVTLNGKPVQTLKLGPDNNDLLHQFVFKNIASQQLNNVQLKFEGTGGLAYQVVGRYFTPWEEKPVDEPLSIDVAYDRTHLAQNDIVTATTTIHNNLPKTANMIMVDLGIPPGFDILSEDLQALQEKAANTPGHLEKFSLTATQAILYFNALGPNQTVTLKVRLRAKFPIHARTFQSRIYEYYDPDVHSIAHPIQLEVATH